MAQGGADAAQQKLAFHERHAEHAGTKGGGGGVRGSEIKRKAISKRGLHVEELFKVKGSEDGGVRAQGFEVSEEYPTSTVQVN